MTQSANNKHRQTQWRERLDRQVQSGQSVAAFCRSEGIAAPTFYWWRARLAKDGSAPAPTPGADRSRDAAPFIDLGTLGAAASTAAFDIRLALPGGIVLTLTAR